jgi:hypothetical protein
MNIEPLSKAQKENLNPQEIKRNPEAAERGFVHEVREADYRDVLKSQMEIINTTPLESLRAMNDVRLGELKESLKTRNEDKEGQKHPETGVPFERKIIINEKGEQDEGVFPVFESKFDAQLPEELYEASDKKQFDECNKQLKEAVEKDPEFAKKFTPEQLEQIKNGETPDGYTWHHNEKTGKMQLVDSETHAKTGHTGGRVIWGGGQENR